MASLVRTVLPSPKQSSKLCHSFRAKRHEISRVSDTSDIWLRLRQGTYRSCRHIFRTTSQICPACGGLVNAKAFRNHVSLCAPEVLDPEGWASGDSNIVQRYVVQRYGAKSKGRHALVLRFGFNGSTPLMPYQVAERMQCSTQTITNLVRKTMKNIPLMAEAGNLEILFEDRLLLAVNKPAGMMVTPPHRLRGGSVMNLAAFHMDGVVPVALHRLDQHTSGALVLGKNAAAAAKVQKEFEARRVEKHYVAVCRGVPESARFVVDAPISKGGAAGSKARRNVDLCNGLSAFTAFEVLASSPATNSCVVRASPRTGRTHQIRVHLEHAGFPIVGDKLYQGQGGGHEEQAAETACSQFPRHALHAAELIFSHPTDKENPVHVKAPLPADMRELVAALGLIP